MLRSPQLRLTVEETYPTDGHREPVRLHDSVLIGLGVRPGQDVRITSDDGASTTYVCQRNDHVPREDGLIRAPREVTRELGVTTGDSVVVSSRSSPPSF